MAGEWRLTDVSCVQCGDPLWRVYRSFGGFNFEYQKAGEYECRSLSSCVGAVAPS